MAVEIFSWSISTKLRDQAGIELAIPGSAVRHVSAARHITNCAMQPGPAGKILAVIFSTIKSR